MTARRWLVLLAALAGLALTASLGAWQLDRARQKMALQLALEQRALLAPVGNAELPLSGASAPEDLLHRRARVQGEWEAARTVYLDNRPMDGRVGFFVLTPLKLAGRNDAILVQRGWVPRNAANREALAPLDTPRGPQLLLGRLAASPSRAYELGQSAGTGPIRQNVDLAAFQAETGLRLLPLVLLETSGTATPAGDGLLRHWPPPAVDVHKHYGYAFQWFALAALILGLYVWFQVFAPRRRRDRVD